MFKAFLYLSLVVLAAFGFYLQYQLNITSEGLKFLSPAPAEGFVLRRVAYIAGAVKKPGVYEISEHERMHELIARAGGFTSQTDADFVASKLNLAASLKDEQHVFIPSPQPTASAVSSSQSDGKKVNINSATLSELTTLPGVGDATAEKIIAARPYTDSKELLDVPGIGEAKLANILPHITW